jgi:hypothetical protein
VQQRRRRRRGGAVDEGGDGVLAVRGPGLRAAEEGHRQGLDALRLEQAKGLGAAGRPAARRTPAPGGGLPAVVLGRREVPARAYASWFNFTGADQQKRVKDLSGGERNRVHLARTLKAGGNVLLLDEPTNDLDVDTLRALEEALLGVEAEQPHRIKYKKLVR